MSEGYYGALESEAKHMSKRERIEVDNLCGNLGCAMPKMIGNDYCPVCTVIESQTPSVPPPARDWKTGDSILVEATILGKYGDKGLMDINIPSMHSWARDGYEFRMAVPLSSIHPMTGRDGGK